MMQRNGRTHGIARHILIHRLGALPLNVHARHTCDHKWCVRPDHIISGSNADNMKDKIGRIVYCRGEKHGNAKLSDIQVNEISHLAFRGDKTHPEIAAMFGISRSMVFRIKRNQHRRKPSSPQNKQTIN